MAGPVYPAPLTKIIGTTLSLSTTVAFFQLGPYVHQFTLFNPTEDFRLHVNPKIMDVNFYNASGSSGSRFVKDGSTGSLLQDLTDKLSGTGTGTVLDAMQTGDFLYICFSDIVGGVHFNIKAANGDASVIAATYWDGTAWAALTETDNTASGGATWAVDGSITFTAPTDWVSAHLGGPDGIVRNDNTLQSTVADVRVDDPSSKVGFWIRFAVGTALDADTEIEEIMGVNRNTSRGYFRGGKEYDFSVDRRVIDSFEAILASGTDTLEVTEFRTGQ